MPVLDLYQLMDYSCPQYDNHTLENNMYYLHTHTCTYNTTTRNIYITPTTSTLQKKNNSCSSNSKQKVKRWLSTYVTSIRNSSLVEEQDIRERKEMHSLSNLRT